MPKLDLRLKHFFHAQLDSMKFILLINVKMPTTVGILTFISRIKCQTSIDILTFISRINTISEF